MSQVKCQISISLDGYAAGPNQSPENPLGEGGERLHEWIVSTEGWRSSHGYEGGEKGPDSDLAASLMENAGAHIMGRKMFGGGEGAWDESWKGWWGDDPPFHTPVYVLTHHEREPLEMEGGTTFHFVTDGIESALAQAREAAGGKDIHVAGGASCVRQFLAAGLLDELFLHISPVLLGGGERLLDDVRTQQLEQVEVISSPAVVHVRYRAARRAGAQGWT